MDEAREVLDKLSRARHIQLQAQRISVEALIVDPILSKSVQQGTSLDLQGIDPAGAGKRLALHRPETIEVRYQIPVSLQPFHISRRPAF